MEDKARLFAEAAHAGINQRRKYTGEPYINHPAAVVELVRSVPHTPEMIAAAWLHDVLEDTPAGLATIIIEFGAEVAILVNHLTDISQPSQGNRAARKAIDRAHTAKASPAAKTIKLADLIDNSRSIVAHGPGFCEVYIAEKALLLEVLREGDATLWAMAADLVNQYVEGVV